MQRLSGNDDWIGEPLDLVIPSGPRSAPVPTNHNILSNIVEDPEEGVELSEAFPDKVALMVERIKELSEDLVEADNPDTVFAGHPINFGMEWSTGWCNISEYKYT